MLNNARFLPLALIAVVAASSAFAEDFDDFARVISVSPRTEQINTPRQECTTVYQQYQRAPSGVAAPVVGGVAGAILGNQVGGGNGRTAATAIGAITGAIVGDRVANEGPAYVERPVRQCRMVDHWEQRNVGYAVTWEYHGYRSTSILPYDPGSQLRLHVSLSPRS
ncbi:MAG: glycine zipper 2TM domain-containing protein [Burkholderiaceae bacterium]